MKTTGYVVNSSFFARFQNNMSVYDYVRELETPTPAKSKSSRRRARQYDVCETKCRRTYASC